MKYLALIIFLGVVSLNYCLNTDKSMGPVRQICCRRVQLQQIWRHDSVAACCLLLDSVYLVKCRAHQQHMVYIVVDSNCLQSIPIAPDP